MPRKYVKKEGKAPAMPLYCSDFKMDTDELTLEEVGAHIRLLVSQWVNRSLPNNMEKLARICGTNVPDFIRIWDELSMKYEVKDGGRLQNRRLEKVREERLKYIKQQTISGRNGGEAKAIKYGDGKPHFVEVAKTYLSSSPSSSTSISSSSSNIDEQTDFVPPQEEQVVEEKKDGVLKIQFAPTAPPVARAPQLKTLHQMMVAAYWDFFENTLGLRKPKKLINSEIQFAALKKIRLFLLNQCVGDETRTLEAWHFILDKDNWNGMEDYLRKGVNLTDIYRNLMKIILHHKNGKIRKQGNSYNYEHGAYSEEAVNALLGLSDQP